MSNTRKPKSLADISKAATPAESVVSICVAGALVAEHQRLEAELEAAQDAEITTGTKLSSRSPVKKLAQRIRDLEAQMREQTFEFVFRALPRRGWSELRDAHPPREGKERVERWNPDTFPAAAVSACCVDPTGMDDVAQFDPFWETLNDGQRDGLFRGAYDVNEAGVSVPFSAAASAALRTSEPTSTTAQL